jgi:hypothetical protein
MQGDDYVALARRVREAVVALHPPEAGVLESRSA